MEKIGGEHTLYKAQKNNLEKELYLSDPNSMLLEKVVSFVQLDQPEEERLLRLLEKIVPLQNPLFTEKDRKDLCHLLKGLSSAQDLSCEEIKVCQKAWHAIGEF